MAKRRKKSLPRRGGSDWGGPRVMAWLGPRVKAFKTAKKKKGRKKRK